MNQGDRSGLDSGFRLVRTSDSLGLYEVDFDPEGTPTLRDAFPMFFQPLDDGSSDDVRVTLLKADILNLLEAFEFPILDDFLTVDPMADEWREITISLLEQAKSTSEIKAALSEVLSQINRVEDRH